MNTTPTLSKIRLASIALGSCVLLVAGCSDRDRASRETADEQQIAVRDSATADRTDNSLVLNERQDVHTTGVAQAQTQAQAGQREMGVTFDREVANVERRGNEAVADQQGTLAATQLEQRIRTELSSANDLNLQAQQLNQINIKVERDTVRLTGKVPSEEISDNLEKRIQDMQEVRTVQNDLEVE